MSSSPHAISLITIFGAASLWLVEASYLPQLWRLYWLKKADEFSFLFPGVNLIGRLAGLGLCVANHSPLFGWWFLTGIVLRLALLCQVVYYRRRSKIIKEHALTAVPCEGGLAQANAYLLK